MSPFDGEIKAEFVSFPRIRGDEPGSDVHLQAARRFSPHTRG